MTSLIENDNTIKYYVTAIEQIKVNDELSEYSSAPEKCNTLQNALIKYFDKLKTVITDIGKSHTYMYIEIKDSNGEIVKSEKIGKYEKLLPIETVIVNEETY